MENHYFGANGLTEAEVLEDVELARRAGLKKYLRMVDRHRYRLEAIAQQENSMGEYAREYLDSYCSLAAQLNWGAEDFRYPEPGLS